MSRILRLSANIALEITNETVSRDLASSPRLYIYDLPAKGSKMLIAEDGQIEQRSHQFSKDYKNVVLSSTPTFFLDDEISAGFHATSRVDNVLAGTTLVSTLDYVKVRMLFAAGFAYDVDDVQAALVTLNIFAIRESDNKRIDLLSFYDAFDASNIQATNQVYFDGQLFSSSIDLSIVDLNSMFNASATDVVALRQNLFASNKITHLFVEHAAVKFSNITTFTKAGHTYKRFAIENTNTQSFNISAYEDDITCDVSMQDGYIKCSTKHNKYDISAYLPRKYKIVKDVYYVVKVDSYAADATILTSTITKISSPSNLFSDVLYKPFVSDTTSYIHVSVTSVIIVDDDVRINNKASVVETDLTSIKRTTINTTIDEQKLYNTTTKSYTKTVITPDVPKIIKMHYPVYVTNVDLSSNLELVPHSFAVDFSKKSLSSSEKKSMLSSTSRLKLSIGSVTVYNDEQSLTIFRIPATAYQQKANTYYLFDDNDNVVWHGKISRVES